MTTITWHLYDNKGRLIRSWPATGDGTSQKKGENMTINQFAVNVASREGKKKSISIAQIKEVLKVVNDLTCGELYKIIRRM
jgi:hypothetical protein